MKKERTRTRIARVRRKKDVVQETEQIDSDSDLLEARLEDQIIAVS